MAASTQFFIWRNNADLAVAVINARNALGLSQVELAHRAGVGRKFMFQLEHGKPTLRADKMLAVLRALDLAPLVLPVSFLSAIG